VEVKRMRLLFGTAANYFAGYSSGRGSGLLGTIFGWALLVGGGYLLITNWDSITVWMHSLDIVTGLDGYEDMSNGFIFICLLVSGFIFMLLLPVFAIVLIVGVVFLNIVICTIVLLVSPSTYKKIKMWRVNGNEYNSSFRWFKW
jgi:nitric oxide reductase large subunit